MADFNFSNQSQSSDSNSMNQTPAHMSNLAPFSMNLTQEASVKLDRDNFLLWKNVIMPIVKGPWLRGISSGQQGMSPSIHQFSNHSLDWNKNGDDSKPRVLQIDMC
ncbi:hypothetical protein Adt_19639 [Abeliophyllum distichum]|uniref:Retrotransposon Copia-like N-terminal domain-containing protein n=1 Tax=Abeliophyllum distichum TaxID=126358 RepID=A0ABD1STH4_9LAMI